PLAPTIPSTSSRASGEPDASAEIGESPVGAQAIERGLDVDVHERRRAFLAGALQPLEGPVRLSEADVHGGDVVGGDVGRPRALTQEVREHALGFGTPAGQPIDATQRTLDPTGAGPERLRRFEFRDGLR